MREHFTLVEPYCNFPVPESESAPQSDFYYYPSYPINFQPPRIHRQDNWLRYTPYTFKNYYVNLKSIGTFDAYLKQFSSKSRSTLLRKVRKFEEASGGKTNWRIFADPSEMDDFFSLALPLADTTYQSRLLDSGLPGSKSFIERAKEAAKHGNARGFLLFLSERPVAYVFCHIYGGIVTYDYVGYDSAAGSLSPGTVLQYLILKKLFSDQNCSIFDFTEGEGAQKLFFGTSSQNCAKTYYLRDTFFNRCLIHSHERLNTFVESIGGLLDRFGLKATVRRFIRRAA